MKNYKNIISNIESNIKLGCDNTSLYEELEKSINFMVKKLLKMLDILHVKL